MTVSPILLVVLALTAVLALYAGAAALIAVARLERSLRMLQATVRGLHGSQPAATTDERHTLTHVRPSGFGTSWRRRTGA